MVWSEKGKEEGVLGLVRKLIVFGGRGGDGKKRKKIQPEERMK